MAKPNRRKKRNHHRQDAKAPSSQQSADEILNRARQQLQEGRYKRAREGFRRLFAQDPDTHREQFIAVTKLAAADAIAERRFNEARRYFAEMEKIGVPALEMGSLRMELAHASGDFAEATELARELAKAEDTESQVKAADTLVLAKSDEAAPVCLAISRLCAKDWDGVSDALREIGRKSPFAHWRLFLRGCVAFYQGDREEAMRNFARLPANSVPARKVPAFELLGGNPEKPADEAVAGACQLSGDAKFGTAVLEVEKRWREGKFLQAYQAAKRLEAAPVWKASLRGQLTRFFQLADESLTCQEEQHRWLEAWPQILGHKPPKMDAEGLVFANITARNAARFDDPEFAEEVWTTYEKNRNHLRPASPRFRAVCCLAAAESLDPDEVPSYLRWDGDDEEADSFERMIRVLRRGIDADPTCEVVHIRLLNLYRRLDRISEANKLLDQITSRFPKSKGAQFEAGLRCLERKSYAKGLKYLRSAREIDPLDQRVLSAIREALQDKATGHYRKKTAPQIAKAREVFAELLEALPATPELGEGRGFALIRWGLLEEICVKPADSRCGEIFAEAEGILHPHVFTFYRNAMGEVLAMKLKNSVKYPPCAPPKVTGSREPAIALDLMRLWRKIEESEPFFRFEWVDWVRKYLTTAIRGLKAADRQLCVEILAECDKGDLLWDTVAERLIAKRLKLDRKDPLFVCRSWDFARKPPKAAKIRETRQEAEKRRDTAALEAIDRFEESQIQTPTRFMPPGMLPPLLADDFAGEGDAGFLDRDDLDDLFELLAPLSIPDRINVLTQVGVPLQDAIQAAQVVSMLDQVRNEPMLPPEPRPSPTPPPRPNRPSRTARRKDKTDPNQLEIPF